MVLVHNAVTWITKIAENNLVKELIWMIFAGRANCVYLEISQVLKEMRWRGEGKYRARGQGGEWKKKEKDTERVKYPPFGH